MATEVTIFVFLFKTVSKEPIQNKTHSQITLIQLRVEQMLTYYQKLSYLPK